MPVDLGLSAFPVHTVFPQRLTLHLLSREAGHGKMASSFRLFLAIHVTICVIFRVTASDFFTVTNKAELAGRRREILYLYAVSVDPGTIKVQKAGKPLVYSQDLKRASDDLMFGCYLTIPPTKRQVGTRYGVYNWLGTFGSNEKTVTSFVKPPTFLLNTRGVYTITVYPDSADGTLLDERLQFGVKWTPGCLAIKWFRGKKRIQNTGPTLTLTKVEGAAGVYTIYRNIARRKRGWAVHIQVIVSDCPRDMYTSDPANECGANCPDCKNGGICDENGDCRCPPFFTGTTCLWPDVWVKRPGTQHYYYISGQATTWSDAQTQCMALGGYLASVTSQAENQFIVDLFDNFNDLNPTATLAFIGLSRGASDWEWINGEQFDFENWDDTFPLAPPFTFRPNVGISLSVSNFGKWQNVQTFFSHPYICEATNIADPYFIEPNEHITCGDLPKGNTKCKGYHFCYGGLYGCSCASGWSGNACDKKCRKGFYGAGCSFRCVQDAGCSSYYCDRFTGRCFV